MIISIVVYMIVGFIFKSGDGRFFNYNMGVY